MSRLVVDCSVTMCWGLPDEANSFAEGVLEAVHEFGGIVPQLWFREVSNAILTSERRRRMTLEQCELFVQALRLVPLEVDPWTTQDRLAETLRIARTFPLTAYDAAYLELARREAVPLCTLDRELIRAAPSAGVRLFELPTSPP